MSKKQNNLSLVKSHIAEYLMYLNPSTKIIGTKLFECPICHSAKASCKIYPQYDYKVTCFNSSCGELGNIFDIFRKCEPDMASWDNNEIANYLIHLLDIKENIEVDKLLEQYYNSGFHLIPLQPNSKMPIQGESWKNNTCHDIRKWKEWIDAGLGLGLVCGKISNIIAIDIDTKEIPEEIKNLIPKTLIQETLKGWHIIVNYDTDFDNINGHNFRRKGYNIDLRANNSYIVIAPTKVDNYTRTWNTEKISNISQELKKFILDLVDKNSQKEEKNPDDEIQKCINNEKLDVVDLSGHRNDTFVKTLGIFRKWMPQKTAYKVMTFLSENWIDKPIPKKELNAMMQQILKYDTFDKKELAKEILAHLQLESVRLANILELTKSLEYPRKDIENALDYLVKEEKVIRIGKHFKALNKLEWDTDFIGLSKPLGVEVPYFEKYVNFENASMCIIGAKTGSGKTHLSMNIIKEFVDKGIQPYYICTEAGSKFSIIGASLGLKEGDYKFKVVPDATCVELEDNSINIIDWIKPPNSDYSKMDTIMENLNRQLIKHGGLVIAMVQIRKDGTFFAPDLLDFYAALVATYNWSIKRSEKNGECIYDSENTYFQTSKIRDSKVGLQYLKIPTKFDKETKRITLRTGEQNVI